MIYFIVFYRKKNQVLPAGIMKIRIPIHEEENAFNVFLILNSCRKRQLSEKDIERFFLFRFCCWKENYAINDAK